MTNIPDWKGSALRAIEIALEATPDISAVHAELLCAKTFVRSIENLSDVVPEDASRLCILLHEVSEYLRDSESYFTAKAIEDAVAQFSDAIFEEVDG